MTQTPGTGQGSKERSPKAHGAGSAANSGASSGVSTGVNTGSVASPGGVNAGAAASPVKRALSEIRRLRGELDRTRSADSEPLAVVGFSHRLPGVAPVPEALHDALMKGLDAVSEVPEGRWDAEAFFDPTRGTPGRMYTKQGGFLDDVAGFDPEFFGISPFEASSIDPQQRLLLEVAWEALEHAGIDPDRIRGSRAGVFVGIASNDYGRMSLSSRERADAYATVGSAFSVAAGRIAYLLDLRGPALSVDTACSSSLAATHLACRSLRSGESELALVGGVNLVLGPEVTIDFCQAGMLAGDGRCKTFDAAADGYVRSEGCGVIVLKRLTDARRDGDRVLATIRGSAINQDGRSSGLTAPNGPAQEAVIRAALDDAGLRPDDIGYLEAHGTGTSLGDPIEVQALGAVFATATRERPLFLGSIKTNLGHTEAAAGITGLIKAVEVLRYGQIPPHLHLQRPNPHIPWEQLPLKIPSEPTPLPEIGGARRVGVSSFGFSGTNAHVVLESAGEQAGVARGSGVGGDEAAPERSHHILTLSAPTEEGLRVVADQYADHLSSTAQPFPDVCFTANAGRAHFARRMAVVATDAPAAAEALAEWLDKGEAPGIRTGRVAGDDRRTTAFLFEESPGSVADTLSSQLALSDLWLSWGIEPGLVAAQGAGHLAGARMAGVLDRDDAARLAAAAAMDCATPNGGSDAESSAENLEAAVAKVTIRPAVLPLLSGATGTLVTRERLGEPGFWNSALTGGHLPADLEAALHAEEVGRVVAISAATKLSDWEAILGALADLHVAGLDPDWVAFEGGRVRSKVSLPTHPFQRRPFWLAPAGGADTATDRPSPWESARDAAIHRAALSPLDVTISSYPAKWEALAELSLAVGRNALVALGAFGDGADEASLDEILERTGVDGLYRPIVARWLEGMAETGLLESEGDGGGDGEAAGRGADMGADMGAGMGAGKAAGGGGRWSWSQAPARADVEPIRDRVSALMADDQPLLRYILHASSMVEGVLGGSESALATLFPDGSFDMAAELYEGTGALRYVNGIAATALGRWIEARPAAAPVRVLEIGAGTGGTTSSLIPHLPRNRSSYDYTDVSEIFLEWGAEKFADVPFLRTRHFDAEIDPRSQGIQPGTYDVVVASNVLHAVRDLRAVLRQVRSLLAPNGLLLLVESTGHLAWHDITTGLIEGWQQFEDDLRTDGPLLEVDSWTRLFAEAGFRDSAAAPPEGSPATVLRQHILLATAPNEASPDESLADAPEGAAAGGGDRAVEGEVERPGRAEPGVGTGNVTGSARNATTGAGVDASTAPEDAADGPGPANTDPAGALEAQLAEAVGTERDEVVMEAVRECVMEILRSDPDRPPSRDARLMELGMDSLMAVRLGNLLKKRLGLATSLPSTLVFDYPTIRRIAELIQSRLEGSAEGARADSPDGGDGEGGADTADSARRQRETAPAEVDRSSHDRESQLAELSEEEVEALLLKRLDEETSG